MRSWTIIPVLVLFFAGLAFGAGSASASPYDGEELQFLDLINEYREAHGLGTLILSDTLAAAAENHSEDMAEHNFFAHDTYGSSHYPVGSEPWDRMAAEGYDYNTYKGENLAVGYETAEKAFEAWKASPSHNSAMLDGKYKVVGIARVYDPDSAYEWYWTTDFGAQVDPSAHDPNEPSEESKPVEKPEEPKDLASIENGGMNGAAVWEQKAKDDARLVLRGGYARLGEYDNGVDRLRQKITAQRGAKISYGIRIKSDEHGEFDDRLLVRLTGAKGKQLAVLERYTGEDRGRWRREEVTIPPRFADKTVYAEFFVRTDKDLLTTFHVDNVALANPGS